MQARFKYVVMAELKCNVDIKSAISTKTNTVDVISFVLFALFNLSLFKRCASA